MPSMVIDRRRFLLAVGAVALARSGRADVTAARAAGEVAFVTAARESASGRFLAVGLDVAGAVAWSRPLPARGHGAAERPGHATCVVVGRRPGAFAMAIDRASGEVVDVVHPPPGRHLYGHAVFTADGRHLLTTENAFEAGHGVIGIYDAADGYRRVGEHPSWGVGPHELVLMPGGETVAVANGGIRTHPASGRRKLGIDTMSPSLAHVELDSGRLVARAELASGRSRRLSIRHLALLDDGMVAMACQDEGPIADALPLVAVHRPGWSAPELLPMPPHAVAALRGYCGSVAASGDWLVVTSPRGGVCAVWAVAGRRFVGLHPLADVCGVAAIDGRDALRLTNGLGQVEDLSVTGTPTRTDGRRDATLQFDNHLLRLSSGDDRPVAVT